MSKFFKGTGFNLALYNLIVLIIAGLGIVAPILSAKIITNITGGVVDQIIIVAIMIFALSTFEELVQYLKALVARNINIKVVLGIQRKLNEEILNLETSEYDKNGSGLFIDRLNKDANDLCSIFVEISYELSSLVGKMGVMVSIYILNKYIFLFSVVTSIISFFITKYRSDYNYKASKELKIMNEEKTSIIAETVRGSRDIKVLNANDSIIDKIMEKVKNFTYRSHEVNMKVMLIRFINRVVDGIISLIYLILCCYLYSNGQMELSVFVTLYYFRSRSRSLLDGISSLFSYLKNFQLAFNRVNALLGDDYEKEKFGDLNIKKLEGSIEFKNVSFAYDKKNIINGMSFKINPNEKVAFVGKSGAGKSTLFSLITKLYDYKKGDILLDGYKLNDLSKDSIRNNISLITQNPYIFNFTIYENFTAVKKNATLKEIREACKLARIDDYIMTLPDKYDTKLGEGGVILSGGQKQRLAIARALLLKTEIILFDEATSALDNETQQEITEAINNMHGEYTILIVAHRLSTIVNCDRIFVVDDGKIIAEGNHKYLLKNCKFYQDLYQQEL